MTRITLFAAGLVAPFLLAAAPVAAQNYPFVPGDYVEISGIIVEDGGGYEYARHIAGLWRKGQEFAKSKGWITDYEVLANVNPREGEPDIYLVTSFASMPDGAEDDRRQAEYRQMMKQTDAQLATASGDRAKYRKLGGSMLLREMKFK